MDRTEGEYLLDFLKKNKIRQEDLAERMGMTRQGLRYHFSKSKIDYEFKMKLRQHGVNAFDENGKIVLSMESKEEKESKPATPSHDSNLKDKLIKLLEERLELEIEKGRRRDEEFQKVLQENRQLTDKIQKKAS
jgi:transcriptional regulator with XRE-family HTH domain